MICGAPLASRAENGDSTVIDVAGLKIGSGDFTVVAGPCAVESRQQLSTTADLGRSAGAMVLRGGAYKPRTSPYSFQGLGPAGLRILAEVGREANLPVVTEVLDVRDVEEVAGSAQILQVGTRNAQNFTLLQEVGRTGLPVMLKRGFGCTIDEWLQAAEYVLREGNSRVILCERGIRTFEPRTRFTLDLSAVPVLKQLSHLPVFVDPSHGSGHRSLTRPLALAAAAAGADGIMVDVHPAPETAQCDGDQALDPVAFATLMKDVHAVVNALGRQLAPRSSRRPQTATTAIR